MNPSSCEKREHRYRCLNVRITSLFTFYDISRKTKGCPLKKGAMGNKTERQMSHQQIITKIYNPELKPPI